MPGTVALSETDPFADAAFVGRLQKLLPMLGSEQPGEADAARRKLIDHLSHYRLSLLDVAARLRNPRGSGGSGQSVSFTQGAREMGLERQLSQARQARDEASQEVAMAGLRIRSLEAELDATANEIGRMAQSQVRVRAFAVISWGIAGLCVLLLLRPYILPMPGLSGQLRTTMVVHPEVQADSGSAMLRIAPGERRGAAAVQDLAIRLSPNEQATIRAFLNRGEPMAVQQQVRIGTQTWLLVRTSTGTGWVRAGDVMQP